MLERVALLTLVALASAVAQFGDYSLTGSIPSARLDYGTGPDSSYAYGQINTVSHPQFGEVVDVYWYACGFQPPGTTTQRQYRCESVGGLAPMSAVRTRGDRRIELNIHTETMLLLYYWSGTPSAWTGEFAMYDGANSYAEESTGSKTRTQVVPIYPSGAIEYRYSLTGKSTTRSSIFTGTVGPALIEAPYFGANGSLSVIQGRVSTRTVPAP